MARTFQRLAIIGAVIASLIGFLSYSPNTGQIAQLNRVRTLGAMMKLTHLIVNNWMMILFYKFDSFHRVPQLNHLVYLLV